MWSYLYILLIEACSWGTAGLLVDPTVKTSCGIVSKWKCTEQRALGPRQPSVVWLFQSRASHLEFARILVHCPLHFHRVHSFI